MPAEGLLDEVVGPRVEAAQDAELVRVGRHLRPSQSESVRVSTPQDAPPPTDDSDWPKEEEEEGGGG